MALNSSSSGEYGSHLVLKCPENWIFSNSIIVNGEEWSGVRYVLIKGRYVFNIEFDDDGGRTRPGQIRASLLQRIWADIGVGQSVLVEHYRLPQEESDTYLTSALIELSSLRDPNDLQEHLDTEALVAAFLRTHEGHFLSNSQILVFSFSGMTMKATVMRVDLRSPSQERGVVTPQTCIIFEKKQEG